MLSASREQLPELGEAAPAESIDDGLGKQSRMALLR